MWKEIISFKDDLHDTCCQNDLAIGFREDWKIIKTSQYGLGEAWPSPVSEAGKLDPHHKPWRRCDKMSK